MRVFSRIRVATLQMDLVKTLASTCIGVVDYALPRVVSAAARREVVFWIERMRVAVEVLSRLAIRVEPEMIETIFDRILQLYRNDFIANDPWLTDPVRNALKRLWRALPKSVRIRRTLDLLNAPIVGINNFSAAVSGYPDPGSLVYDHNLLPGRTHNNEEQWQETVRLLVRGLRTGGEARKRAARRLLCVALADRLTDSEAATVARALWSDAYTKANDLPGETSLFDWELLVLPQLKHGSAESRFRSKWLTANTDLHENSPTPDEILSYVGIGMSWLKNYEYSLKLTKAEREYLIEVIDKWANVPVPHHSFPLIQSHLLQPIRRALRGLPTIVSEITVPVATGETLYNKVHDLNEVGIPGFTLIAGLINAIPNRSADATLLMRMGLTSDNETLAVGAALGLHHWLLTSSEADSRTQPPPEDLVREIGIAIATRRRGCLPQALRIATWVFERGNVAYREAIRHLVLQGLSYLFEELRYDRKHDKDDSIDVPLLRRDCTVLARTMANQEPAHDPIVSRWLEISTADPLPEVRYVE